MRAWGRALAVLVTAMTVAGGTTTAIADEADRLTGEDAAHAEAGELAEATTIVPMPDLAVTHRLPGGGMNLWRIPLSELENGYGTPQLVKTLNYGGFSYDNSRTIAGDFGDITASDDGTADHVIWHAQPNGGVLLWALGGGGDTTPRIWQDLRTGGWSWANSRPRAGDATGDGWDDLIVQHRTPSGVNTWEFESDGQRLGAPWLHSMEHPDQLDTRRYAIGDFSGDGADDMLTAYDGRNFGWPSGMGFYWSGFQNGGGGPGVELRTGGWSYAASRQLAGDVTGDGLADVVTIHAQYGGGLLVWLHRNCAVNPDAPCFETPVIWQDLRTGGWSWGGSRQHLADTNGDGFEDLVSVHSQIGNPGMLIWRHVSTGNGLAAPEIVANLKTGGWSYSDSREGVAGTYGVLVN